MSLRILSIIVMTAITIYSIIVCDSFRINEETLTRSAARCKKLSQTPDFDASRVAGKTWRIYYSWNLKIAMKCLDITFKNATPSITNRIRNDMKNYLNYEPNWDAAVLHITLGTANYEMLLIPDQGAAGSYVGVPNVARAGTIAPIRNSVPKIKYFLKLLQDGGMLLMVDCHIGVSSLSSLEKSPYQDRIEYLAHSLSIGIGNPACITDKKTNERMYNYYDLYH